jgi:hypothetical protein
MNKINQKYLNAFPNSHKIYVEVSRSDIQVPMREITYGRRRWTPNDGNTGQDHLCQMNKK